MKLDKLGRLCIPRKSRKEVDLRIGDRVALFPNNKDGSLYLQRIDPANGDSYLLTAEIKSENRLQVPKHVRDFLGWDSDTEVVWERVALTYDLVVKRAWSA